MACKDCTKVETPSCGNCYCDDSVCTPCELQLADRCVKITSELPNLGTCLSRQDNFECADLNTFLTSLDSWFADNCDSGGLCTTNVVTDSQSNRICNETVTIDLPSNATTGEGGINGDAAYMRYWDTAPATESLVYVENLLAKMIVDTGSEVGVFESRGSQVQMFVNDGTDASRITMTKDVLSLIVSGDISVQGLTNFGSGAQNATALAALGSANLLYIKEDANGDRVLAITF